MGTVDSSGSSFMALRHGPLSAVAVLVSVLLAFWAAPGSAEAATARPTGIEVTTQTATTVVLRWSTVARAPQYRVKYSTRADFTDPSYGELPTAGTRLINLTPATTYYVKVRVISSTGAELSPYSRPVKVTTAPYVAAPMRVGSYNVRCYNCYAKVANEGTWPQRRDAVVEQIRSQDLDVLGLQEASPSAVRTRSGKPLDYSQFQDLTARLGGGWKVTSNARYNCARSTTPSRCQYRDLGAAKGNRILYNSDRVELLDSGSELLPSAKDSQRWAAWARLRQRNTGLEFMFSTTHLEARPAMSALRAQQAAAAVAMIEAHNPGGLLPMVAVGDLNSNRSARPSNAPYETYLALGFVDPIGGATSTGEGATVEHRVNTWLNSANGFERQARGRVDQVNGTYIDYIFTTPMRVSEWETAAKLDAGGRFVGRIPSDHNLIRATVWLPAA